MACPNCGAYGSCLCLWSEMQKAIEIIRQREAEARKARNPPTRVDQWNSGVTDGRMAKNIGSVAE